MPLVATAIGGCLGLPALTGQEVPGAVSVEPSILDRSPFIPPGFTPPGSGRTTAAKAAAGGYEFKGFYRIGDTYRFLVSEPRSNDGDWVELGESSDNFEVRRFDPDSETLTLFFNNSEQQLKLAELAANPTPMPVSGQIKTAGQEQQATPAPVRRTIRPTTRPTPTTATGTSASPPPPAWLEKLREEAAARRAQAIQGRSGVPGGVNASGSPDFSPPPPPDSPPPTPPPNLSEIDIPPPPTELPPPPPPEVMEKIQQSIRSGPPRG